MTPINQFSGLFCLFSTLYGSIVWTKLSQAILCRVFSLQKREASEIFNVGMREQITVQQKLNSILFYDETKINRCCIIYICLIKYNDVSSGNIRDSQFVLIYPLKLLNMSFPKERVRTFCSCCYCTVIRRCICCC